MQTAAPSTHTPAFIWLFLGKVLLLAVTIVAVWSIYAYLHAYRLDWLGWFYVHLQPLTNGLYSLVETYFPEDVKYKIRGAITDDLGQRSLFLLLLTAATELTLYSLFKLVKALLQRLGGRRREGPGPRASRAETA
ncbi:MAG: hypothetical protein AB7K67_08140 [Hyphomicrobiaceae bacterium]